MTGVGWRRGLLGRLTATVLTLTILALTGIAGCAANVADLGAAGSQGATASPGTLLSASLVDNPAPALRAIGGREWRVSYSSRSGIDNHPVVVTGVVLVPAGAPPAGGWPVVSFGHGTTGVGDQCAPSRSPTLRGELGALLPLVALGYLVTATDYEGLGSPGPHPYLLPLAAGRDVIDAVRAARALVPQASARWLSVGISQGGQASWAAAELVPDWGRGLDFLGSVAFAPAVNLAPLIANVPDRLSPTQKGAYILLLTTLRLLHPELDYADYLSGSALVRTLTVDSVCVNDFGVAPNADFIPRSPGVLPRARQWLAEISLPRQRAAGPLLVIQGLADDTVEPAWTTSAVQRACALGDTVDYLTYPGVGHPATLAGAGAALAWVAGRFAGRPAPHTCGPSPG